MKLEALKARVISHPLVARADQSIVGHISRALVAIRIHDRAVALAGLAFIALLPLMILLASIASDNNAAAVGAWIVQRFGLTETSAAAVDLLFASPPSASSGLSIASGVMVLISSTSFARSIQRTYEIAWKLPATGLRGTLVSFGGSLILFALLIVLAAIADIVENTTDTPVLLFTAQLIVAVPAWLVITHLLTSRRIAWRWLLPSAALSAAFQVAATWAGTVYVPYLIERNAERYGMIGVAVALISWLVVLAVVIVGSAVIGGEVGAKWARSHGLVPTDDPPQALLRLRRGPRSHSQRPPTGAG